MLSVTKFKLYAKTLASPPQTYDGTLHHLVAHTDNVYGKLHTTPTVETSKPSLAKKLSSTPTPRPEKEDIITRMRQKLVAENELQPPRTAEQKSTEQNSAILKKELGKKGKTKPSPPPKEDDPEEDLDETPPVTQAAAYATELLCRGIYATHAVTLLIADDVVWIWWFDRQGAIQSTGINFIQDLPYFVTLLIALQRFNQENWGIVEQLVPEIIQDLPCFTVEFLDPQLTVVAQVEDPIYERYTLVGRSTRVYKATGAVEGVVSASKDPAIGKNLPGTALALKVYWPEESHPNEADILREAYKVGESNDSVREHLPELLASCDHSYSSATIRSRLDIEKIVDGHPNGSRTLRFLLFKLLQPIGKLPVPMFMRGWRDCLICHYCLWESGIEHGDISLGNLMWDSLKEKGILGDFDLATLRHSPQKRGRERTGTIPFMAIDLLNCDYFDGKIQRLYRHDLESFVWVLIWASMQDNSAWEEQLWKTSNYVLCQTGKLAFIAQKYHQVEPTQKEHERWCLVLALVKWMKLVNSYDDSTSRDKEPKETFDDVMMIIKQNWVWD